jgi:hypothetical protein
VLRGRVSKGGGAPTHPRKPVVIRELPSTKIWSRTEEQCPDGTLYSILNMLSVVITVEKGGSQSCAELLQDT